MSTKHDYLGQRDKPLLGGLLKSMGWQEMGETKFLNDERGSVYVRDL